MMTTTDRPRSLRRLLDLRIAEVSGVDRPAHLHDGWLVVKAADLSDSTLDTAATGGDTIDAEKAVQIVHARLMALVEACAAENGCSPEDAFSMVINCDPDQEGPILYGVLMARQKAGHTVPPLPITKAETLDEWAADFDARAQAIHDRADDLRDWAEDGDDPLGRLDALANRRAADRDEPFPVAYAAVLETDEGHRLYAVAERQKDRVRRREHVALFGD